MDTTMLSYQQLTQAISELPTEVLPELANFIEYLRFKANFQKQAQSHSGSALLLSIAGVGTTGKNDISECSPRPKFGSAKGLIEIADDFDEPLEEFRGY